MVILSTSPLTKSAPTIRRTYLSSTPHRTLLKIRTGTCPADPQIWEALIASPLITGKSYIAERKTVGPVYTLTSMLKSESAHDDVSNQSMEMLGEFADYKDVFDFGELLEM